MWYEKLEMLDVKDWHPVLHFHYTPHSNHCRFLAEFEMRSTIQSEEVGTRYEPRSLAVMSLMIGGPIGGVSTSGLGLWVDSTVRRKGIGKTLLGCASGYVQSTLAVLPTVYPQEISPQVYRSVEVYVTSHPDPKMNPPLNVRDWYGTLYRIFQPQGFEVNRQEWSQDPLDGGPRVPSLMRRYMFGKDHD